MFYSSRIKIKPTGYSIHMIASKDPLFSRLDLTAMCSRAGFPSPNAVVKKYSVLIGFLPDASDRSSETPSNQSTDHNSYLITIHLYLKIISC